MNDLIDVLDIIGVIAFAISGAMTAIKKRMDLESQREIGVRFKLTPCNDIEAYGPLQVTLIPLKNFPGQCAYVMVSLSEWKQQQAEDDSQ